MAGKWNFEVEQSQRIYQAYRGRYALRNRTIHAVAVILGPRCSEVKDLRIEQVRADTGEIRNTVTWTPDQLKGGRPKRTPATPKPPTKPEHYSKRCHCLECKAFRGELPPRKRRAPDPRMVPIPPELQALLRTWLYALTEKLGALKGEWPLFPSRKHAADGSLKSLSRQQVWWILRQAMAAAGVHGNYSTHSWRKSAAAAVYEATGNDMVAVKQFLNHRSVQTTEAYLRSCDKRLRDAVNHAAVQFIGVAA
jgi:integrase